MSDGNDKGGGAPESGNGDSSQVFESGRPAVAAAPGKTLLVLLGAAGIVAIIVKSLFFASAPAPVKAPPPAHETVAPPTALNLGQNLNTAGTLTAPPAPPKTLPPPPVVLPPPTVVANKGPSEEALKQRIRSPMIISGGGLGAALSGKKTEKPAGTSTDPNMVWAQTIEPSHAERADATKISNLNITIAQGKVIQGVLETAINSDLPGMIRAIVSHDTYAEAGRDVLIPKGSRLIGTYNASIKRGQGRVFIIWTRVIRPDGVDIQIDSPGMDALGRAGMGGDVDNKYFEMFSTSLLTSSLDIGVAAIGQGLFGTQQQTTTTSGGGGTTTTSSPTATAMQQAVQNVGTVGSAIVNSTINLQPTITIDQGTPINIFVNKDLVFPMGAGSQARFVE